MGKYVKPTLETKFHIDFSWWQKEGKNLRAFLQSHACPVCREEYQSHRNKTFDWVDPRTGEVFKLDYLWHLIRTHCIHNMDFISNYTPLTTAIFRVFIANDNVPLNAVEIQDQVLVKGAETILKTIGGRRIYQGIRAIES